MAVEVTDSTFQNDVLSASQEIPVLVDFWAEWCGPCRMVGPVVEALEQSPDYAGRFRLAKVNTDQNPAISGHFGISSIPAFKLFSKGQVIGEFVGALPEHALRRFLDQNLPDPAAEALADQARQDPLAAARQAMESGATGEATAGILWQGVLELVRSGSLKAAGDAGIQEVLRMLRQIPAPGLEFSDARIAFETFLQKDDEPDFAEQLKNLPALLGDESAARQSLEYFLGRVEAAAGDERKTKKDSVLLAFQLLGNQGALVNEYRRRLSSLLF